MNAHAFEDEVLTLNDGDSVELNGYTVASFGCGYELDGRGLSFEFTDVRALDERVLEFWYEGRAVLYLTL